MIRSPSLLLVALVLCLLSPLQAAPNTPPVFGTLIDATKSESMDGGQVTVLTQKGAINYQVTGNTRFEVVRGTQRSGSSFLAEHVGQKVAVTQKPGANPATASLVQVMLPPPPPAHHTPPKPGHHHGTVIHIGEGKLTIRPHHFNPLPPVLGTISDLKKSETTPTASITVQVNGKPRTFEVNPATWFIQVRGDVHKPSNFLKEHKGETALIFPRLDHPHVAGLVEILLPGGVNHAHAAHHHPHHLTYLVTPATKFSRHRDGHTHPATVAAVAVGEYVSVLPSGIHSHLAASVEVLLPHAIHGELVSATPTALVLKGHHHGDPAKAAQGTVTIPLLPTTHFAVIDGKNKTGTNVAALKAGARVIAYPAGVPPHPAEAVEIHPHHTATTTHPSGRTTFTTQGVINSVNGDHLYLKVSHPASGNKPVSPTQQAFRLTGAVITNHEHKPLNLAALRPGETVTVHALSGTPPLAHTIQVHDKSATATTQHHLTAQQQKQLQEHEKQLLQHQKQHQLHVEQQKKLEAQIQALKKQKKLTAEQKKQLAEHEKQLLHHQQQQKLVEKQLAEHQQKLQEHQKLAEKKLAEHQKQMQQHAQLVSKQTQAQQKQLEAHVEAQLEAQHKLQQQIMQQQQEQMKRYLAELQKQQQKAQKRK